MGLWLKKREEGAEKSGFTIVRHLFNKGACTSSSCLPKDDASDLSPLVPVIEGMPSYAERICIAKDDKGVLGLCIYSPPYDRNMKLGVDSLMIASLSPRPPTPHGLRQGV